MGRLTTMIVLVALALILALGIPLFLAGEPDAISSQSASGTDTSPDEITVPTILQSDSDWLKDLEAQVSNGTSPTTSADQGSFDAVVRPGESIQEVVDALPEGSRILIESGVHIGQKVRPKSRMVFVGGVGAVLDGDGSTNYAFVTWDESPAVDVTIRRLEVRNYAPPAPHGAIHSQAGTGWIVEDCEVHHSQGVGIRVVGDSVVRNCYLHHNERMGLKAGGSNILIENNEIAFNNPDYANDPTWDAGGLKFGSGEGVIIRDNFVHDNWGHGVWADLGAIHTLYEGNRIENNTYSGINHEISYDAVIRNNIIRNNGLDDPRDGLRGAGIVIKGPNVEVYENVLEHNKNGIVLIENDRGSGEHGSYEVRNVYVHDNKIVDSGDNGGERFKGPTTLFETSVFDLNQYRYEGDYTPRWFWDGSTLTWDEWRSTGNDRRGELLRG